VQSKENLAFQQLKLALKYIFGGQKQEKKTALTFFEKKSVFS